MTCYSRDELSFKAFLTPFEVEVWLTLVLIVQTIVAVFAAILITKLQWKCLKSISFAQLVVISMVLEKPTDLKPRIRKISEFRILFGFWMLLLQIFTNGYIGLSVTSISAPLESKSVTRFEQLTKPGCELNDLNCHIDRIKGFHQYITLITRHVGVTWQKAEINDEAYWAEFYAAYGETFTFDRNRTLEAVRDQSHRIFDDKTDFVLLPYSVEENISKRYVTVNDFYSRLYEYLDNTVTKFLRQFDLGEKIVLPDLRNILKLVDLLDPWHIPHPVIGNLSDMKYIKNEWDIEHAIVQCGRTALVLYETEIRSEMRYFEKHYPWLKFFKSKLKLLTTELGWKFDIRGPSLSFKVFGRLHVAGIIQLLEI
ncbi:hypothetical protein Fcan01_15871 [Folsomia candida]|uniref:Uncharacterized protein n=1 Tax=Folsomia candida TaxID=158441 RepID=A0A226DXC4_FOLCA|nr:hypothetical protein Fcan01_15871 [Folsomia candida]